MSNLKECCLSEICITASIAAYVLGIPKVWPTDGISLIFDPFLFQGLVCYVRYLPGVKFLLVSIGCQICGSFTGKWLALKANV